MKVIKEYNQSSNNLNQSCVKLKLSNDVNRSAAWAASVAADSMAGAFFKANQELQKLSSALSDAQEQLEQMMRRELCHMTATTLKEAFFDSKISRVFIPGHGEVFLLSDGEPTGAKFEEFARSRKFKGGEGVYVIE